MDCRKARELLPGHVDDVLSSSERASLLEHLNQCESCRNEWQSLESVVRMVRSLPEVNPPSAFRAQLFQRLQSETPVVVVHSRRTARARWYQWSVAAAAVLALLWSVRFASVRPSAQRPTDHPSSTTAVKTPLTGGEPQKTANVLPASGVKPSAGEEGEVRRQEAQPLVAQSVPQVPVAPATAVDPATSVVSNDRVSPVSTTGSPGTATPVPDPVPPVKKVQSLQDGLVVASAETPVESTTPTIQTTPNPSFTAPRNEIAGDRHREDAGFGITGSGSSTSLTTGANLRPEEYVTRLRIARPGPDELRQRLKQLTQGEKLAVVEIVPPTRGVQFAVRAPADKIARLAIQLGTMSTVVERESIIVSLAPQWKALQDIVVQARLEITRREALLRQTENQAQIDQQELELQKARTQLQGYEKELHLLEARFGTSVLEVGY